MAEVGIRCKALLVACAAAALGFASSPAVEAAPDYVPDEAVLQKLSRAEAKRELATVATAVVGCMGFTMNCTYIRMGRVQVANRHLEFEQPGREPWRVPIASLKIEVEKFAFGTETGVRLDARWWMWFGREFDWAKRIADALFVLQKHDAGYEDPRVEADFQSAVKAFRDKPGAMEFPESARRHLVVAEAAVRDKNLEKAADSYAAALQIAPWWPEGRFNLAMILGELNEPRLAAREMKRYLVLLPDAANARAAQDKIYEWEDKAGR